MKRSGIRENRFQFHRIPQQISRRVGTMYVPTRNIAERAVGTENVPILRLTAHGGQVRHA